MVSPQPKKEEWPTQEMLQEIEDEIMNDEIDAIYDTFDEETELLNKTSFKTKYPVGVINRKSGEIITLGEHYADYAAWRNLKDWNSVFKNPGYHGCAEIDVQVLCIPNREDNPWM